MDIVAKLLSSGGGGNDPSGTIGIHFAHFNIFEA